MLAAKFYRGPIDGLILMLPTEQPWSMFTVPVVDNITLQYFYLLAGKDRFQNSPIYLYLYDEPFALDTVE